MRRSNTPRPRRTRTLFGMGLAGRNGVTDFVGFATPLGAWCFEQVLVSSRGWRSWPATPRFVAPIAILNCMHSYWQGLVHFHKTRAITESVVCFLVVDCSLALGVWSGKLAAWWLPEPPPVWAIWPKAFGCGGVRVVWGRLRQTL